MYYSNNITNKMKLNELVFQSPKTVWRVFKNITGKQSSKYK